MACPAPTSVVLTYNKSTNRLTLSWVHPGGLALRFFIELIRYDPAHDSWHSMETAKPNEPARKHTFGLARFRKDQKYQAAITAICVDCTLSMFTLSDEFVIPLTPLSEPCPPVTAIQFAPSGPGGKYLKLNFTRRPYHHAKFEIELWIGFTPPHVDRLISKKTYPAYSIPVTWRHRYSPLQNESWAIITPICNDGTKAPPQQTVKVPT